MPIEIISALISSVIGGLLVAIVNYLFTKKKTEAEIEKLRAEADKIKAEAEKVRAEIGRLNTSVAEAKYYESPTAEKIIYDGSQGVEGYDVTMRFGEIIDGVIISRKKADEVVLKRYTYDGKEKDQIPKNELLEGTRKLRVSFETRVTKGTGSAIVLFISDQNREISRSDVEINQTEWKKSNLYFSIPPDENCRLNIFLGFDTNGSSVQLRNLVVAERSK